MEELLGTIVRDVEAPNKKLLSILGLNGYDAAVVTFHNKQKFSELGAFCIDQTVC